MPLVVIPEWNFSPLDASEPEKQFLSKVVMHLTGEGEGEGALIFFLVACATGFPKVGSRERVFFEKQGVLGPKILKFCILRIEILAKNKGENAKFFLKLKMGAHERHIDGELVG